MSDITLTLPDGNQRNYPAGTTGMDVAKDISTSLAKKAISCTVNGEHRDLSRAIEGNADFAIHTMQDDAQALGVPALLLGLLHRAGANRPPIGPDCG